MNNFERALAVTLGEGSLAKIQKIKVGIAGAGGLGSNCAQFLVRSGFKYFKIVDYDKVDHSNLNRQFYFKNQVGLFKVDALYYNLLKINPAVAIETIKEKIDQTNVQTLFQDCDVVIEAVDGPEDKRLLVEAYLNRGKLLVAVSGMAGWGNTEAIRVRQVTEDFFLVGDRVSEVSPANPPLAPGVVVAAAKQADIVLQHVLDQ
ncbi:thiamine biosynthesis protein ThiF [Desulforamulus reducens MI-1]|uniref:Thiamine biosynthesis protein ThiF n=1 Tax=Desulforamulus reducens (strain ATCC BAA-1160 / DSM 100696 / MI-1) TaxID=349161 RepID=A4J0M2_DESRM|nr:sulfur carrier protein ThiS adenylyltransferase ThiF [Desulforamulus reducens]ABO48625.1 thiamine biosynthesis protein ThiF [Desulforamulus reducens MI-1]